MKGVILAGGKGTRLYPLTVSTNKHLLPIYNKPMIYYPLQTLINAGVKKIMITVDPENAGAFLQLLGSGSGFGAEITYRVQDSSCGLGIAAALRLAEDFAAGEKIAVILGDNVFEDDFGKDIEDFEKQKNGARIFLKEVKDPQRFGVPELNGKKVVGIEEKPKNPKSGFAVTGLYLFDSAVFSIIKTLKPSARGELEITDVNNAYIKKELMNACFVKGYWTDAGTFESLHNASCLAKEREK